MFAAAAFVRLCVETIGPSEIKPIARAAAFVRLCVETDFDYILEKPEIGSRLRAAVC